MQSFEDFTKGSNNENQLNANEGKLVGAEWSLWTDIDEFVISMKQKYKGKINDEKIMDLIKDYIND